MVCDTFLQVIIREIMSLQSFPPRTALFRLSSVLVILCCVTSGCRRDIEPTEAGVHLEQPVAPIEGEIAVVEGADAEATAAAKKVVEAYLDYDFRGARLRTDHPLKSRFDALMASAEGGSETIWVVDAYRVGEVAPRGNGYEVTVTFPHAVLMAGDFEPIEERREMQEKILVRDGKIIEEGGIAHVGLDTVVEHVRRVASAEDADRVRTRVSAQFNE